MGALFVVVFRLFLLGGRRTVRHVGYACCLSSSSLRRAARVSCGLVVQHARLTSGRVTWCHVRLCRSWFSCSSSSTQRWSSPARAHHVIGAGRVKRLVRDAVVLPALPHRPSADITVRQVGGPGDRSETGPDRSSVLRRGSCSGGQQRASRFATARRSTPAAH